MSEALTDWIKSRFSSLPAGCAVDRAIYSFTGERLRMREFDYAQIARWALLRGDANRVALDISTGKFVTGAIETIGCSPSSMAMLGQLAIFGYWILPEKVHTSWELSILLFTGQAAELQEIANDCAAHVEGTFGRPWESVQQVVGVHRRYPALITITAWDIITHGQSLEYANYCWFAALAKLGGVESASVNQQVNTGQAGGAAGESATRN
jgi:hypothetical protein